MKYLIVLIAVLFLIGCQINEPIVGNDKDEHGCIGSAGYQWCESRQECVRAWEDYCEELKDQFNKDTVTDFESCSNAGLPVMESYPMQCTVPDGKTYTQEIDKPAVLPDIKKGITTEELAKHNDLEDCWVAYDGTVYDLTDYMQKHPGGMTSISKTCGTADDFSNAFTGQHGNSQVDMLIQESTVKGVFI